MGRILYRQNEKETNMNRKTRRAIGEILLLALAVLLIRLLYVEVFLRL